MIRYVTGGDKVCARGDEVCEGMMTCVTGVIRCVTVGDKVCDRGDEVCGRVIRCVTGDDEV